MKVIVVGLVIASVASGGSFAVAAQTIGANSTAGSDAGGSIAGHVTNAHAQPIDTYSVIVFPTDRKSWFDPRVVTFARPAQDGGFEVVGLAPGEYWVAAVDAIQGNQGLAEWTKPEVLEKLSPRATRVVLGERERFMTVLRLIRR
jgi:transcriptional regulator GlxA family with amidase domain